MKMTREAISKGCNGRGSVRGGKKLRGRAQLVGCRQGRVHGHRKGIHYIV